MSTTAPRKPLASLLEIPEIAEVRPPRWFDRLPRWLSAGAILVLLMAISAVLRTRTIGGQLWFEEAGAVGLASHSLGQLPGVLHASGASPLYYVVLHFWIDGFGSGATATHLLSLLFALACIPLGMWVGWSIDGRRAGVFVAIMFAFSSYLTRYGQDSEPYALMVFLGLLGVGGFIHAFVFRRRAFLWLFWAALSLMLYTQGTALLFAAGAIAGVAVVWRCAPDPGVRRGVLRDAALCFGGALLVYLPWLPTSISQIAHDTAPWSYTPLQGATVPSQMLGSERVDVVLLITTVIACAGYWSRARRRTPEAVVLWTLLAVPAGALLAGRIAGFFIPVWAWRLFAPAVAALLLLGGVGAARARVVGVAAMVFCVAFLANPGSFAPSYKSDMQDVAGELGALLHPGDVVAIGQPEQAPLAWYYLPAGVRFVTTASDGVLTDPSYMNWAGAMGRLQRATPSATIEPLIASLRRGQQLLYVRPLTEGERNWTQRWSVLVRRRSAQWGQFLAGEVAAGILKPVAVAPHNYRSSCCIASTAVLYEKAS